MEGPPRFNRERAKRKKEKTHPPHRTISQAREIWKDTGKGQYAAPCASFHRTCPSIHIEGGNLNASTSSSCVYPTIMMSWRDGREATHKVRKVCMRLELMKNAFHFPMFRQSRAVSSHAADRRPGSTVQRFPKWLLPLYRTLIAGICM